MRWGSVRVPIKPFFVGTGALLYYLAFVFAGEAVRELQESGVLGTSLVRGLSSVEALGIYPTWEGLALQAGLVLAFAAALAFQFFYKPWLSSSRGRTTI